MSFQVLHGDCRERLKSLAESSVDSVVCDPPYELGFMGKGWDRSGIAYDVSVWFECLRALKPGGHLLAFGGSRTYHRLACAIEDAGFEIRDQIQWIYGSGFPKSLDVSKAIDAAAGAERAVIGRNPNTAGRTTRRAGGLLNRVEGVIDRGNPFLTVGATDAAKQWNGWGTALKPAHEPIVLARKPLIGTVAENVLKHGTGGLNVDGCRIEGAQGNGNWTGASETRPLDIYDGGWSERRTEQHVDGRWPANVVHDGSEEVLAGFPVQTQSSFRQQSDAEWDTSNGIYKGGIGKFQGNKPYDDLGSAARFFYCAKASKEDREDGLESLPETLKQEVYGDGLNSATKLDPRMHTAESVAARPLTRNPHPTVKPTDLMRYLCRLVTPPGGTVLDPFCGSGSTGKAAILERFNFTGIELSAEYCELAEKRIEAVTRQGLLMFA